METKLFLNEYVDTVLNFELKQLPSDLSELKKEMLSWDQPWRKESLLHYSQLGWSFIAEKDGAILGYVLAQPILFFNNWTQSLWVEHISFQDQEVGYQLMDVVIRWAKTKHLQKVLLNSKSKNCAFVLESFPGFSENSYVHLSTTKMSEA